MNYSARKSLAAFALVSGIAAAAPGYAQTAPATGAATSDDKVLKLDKFEVTGSYIPVAGSATAIPVTVIDSKAIENSGVATDMLEILRKTTPQFSGNGNLGSTNANINAGATGGGSAVAFRNTQTLVLINGRRSAYAPIVSSGGLQFVDVNLIPPSAIEKIEILMDGASAIYGTDAVAGVVNFILKSDYKGAEATMRYGYSDNTGHYAERSANFVTGASNDTTSLTVSASWARKDPLFQYERQYSNPAYGTGTFAGVVSIGSRFFVLNPSLNAPPMNQDLTPEQLVANGTYIEVNGGNLTNGVGNEKQYAFNLAQYVTLLQGQDQQAATINFNHKWTDMVEVFGDLMYSATQSYSQLNAQPTTTTAAANDPRNPFNVSVVARNRFVTLPRQYYYDNTNIRGVLGLRGQINDSWGYEAAMLNNKITQDYHNSGLIDTNARIAAVSGGVLNYFARQQAAGAIQSSGMFGTALGQAVSELETYDARVNGKLFDLPAGELGFAAGVEWRVEKLSQNADRNSQGDTFGWDSATTLDPFVADRDVNAYFANVRIPILGKPDGKGMSLAAEVAVRHEIYSDTDDPTVPKYQLTWHPINEEFLLRGTYSESFAAPTLFQLFGPGGIGFTTSLNLQAVSGPNITGQANLRSGSNKNLLPATSKNYTFGAVWSPKAVKGLSITVDYFDIKQDSLISTIGSTTILQDVELTGTASPYASFVRFGPRNNTSMFTQGTPVTGIGQISGHAIDEVYVTDTLVNISWQKLNGVDFKFDYTWNSDTLGRFDASLAGIWWNTYEYQALPDTDVVDTVGQATNFNGTIPEYQTYLSLNWTRGKWGAFLGWTYIPEVSDVNWYDASDSTADESVEAFNSVDVSVSYTFGSDVRWLKGLTLRLGANNVFNESPPMAQGTFTEANADTATYGAIGRFMYIEGKYRF